MDQIRDFGNAIFCEFVGFDLVHQCSVSKCAGMPLDFGPSPLLVSGFERYLEEANGVG